MRYRKSENVMHSYVKPDVFFQSTAHYSNILNSPAIYNYELMKIYICVYNKHYNVQMFVLQKFHITLNRGMFPAVPAHEVLEPKVMLKYF